MLLTLETPGPMKLRESPALTLSSCEILREPLLDSESCRPYSCSALHRGEPSGSVEPTECVLPAELLFERDRSEKAATEYAE